MADYFTEERLSERQVAAECTSLVSLMSMAAASDCIAMVTESIATAFADKLDIQVLDCPFTSKPVHYRLLTHNRERQSLANMWLREKIKSYFC
mgnify:FL=1